MLRKYRLPLLLLSVIVLNVLIYLWAVWTAENNVMIFEKSARNSGRPSAAINLILILGLGYYGLKNIYKDKKMKELFQILISLYAVNHLIHFFFVYQNFENKPMKLIPKDNIHGIITFVGILLLPFILAQYKNLNKLLYYFIIIHLINTTWFMIRTFHSKIKPDIPVYLHQIGIWIMVVAIFFILYKVYTDRKLAFNA